MGEGASTAGSASSPSRPVTLSVTDDLQRSRLTVLFRWLLALPHLVWLALWTTAVGVAVFAAWIAALIDGRLPRVLHDFLAAYVRYAVHVAAYVFLVSERFPGFTGRPGYAVDVEIAPPGRQGRWTVAFRVVLAVPALALTTVLIGGGGGTYGGVAASVALLAWFAALAVGRMPSGLRDLAAYAIGYAAQTGGYVLLLGDRYPTADPSVVHPRGKLPPHPVRLAVTDRLARSRLTVFFRLLLALPHLVWVALWTLVVVLLLPLAWLVALVLGRLPVLVRRFLVAYVRYAAHVSAFLSVVGGPFPGFSGASYPVDITIEPADRQGRLSIAFRALLAVPAIAIAAAYGTALATVAVLGWFAALAIGRMPPGLRSLGAAAIRYSAQTSAYLALVTDRYPYSAPAVPAPTTVEEAR